MGLWRRLWSLAVFLVVAGLGGALTAGLVIPAASILASSGREAVGGLGLLPIELETPPLPERSRLLNADGSVLTYFFDQNRYSVTLDQVSEIMRKAQVAIEDHRFYEHGPIDVQATIRALVRTSGGTTQGASSITQQYVRLVLVGTAERTGDALARAKATENTLARKIREMRFAAALEERYTKDEILERYLNISYYGDGAYGIATAARHFFNVSAKDLDLPQAAMLAGLIRNPVTTNPVKYPKMAIERRNDVLDRMAELKIITEQEAAEAKEVPFDPKKVRKYKLGCANAEFPFICDYAWRTLMKTKSLGATKAEREDRVLRGGLTIKTQIDPKAQRKAEKTIAAMISPKDPVVSVIVMLEPKTGQIVAMAQSRPKMGKKKGQTFYNYAVSHAMGGAEGYQGGSTFKAFVAAAALENEMGAYGVFDARARMSFGGETFKSCDGPFTQRKWDVVNASPSGRMNMFRGVTSSVNTYFAQLIQAVGVCESVKMAKRLGLEMSMGGDLVKKYGAIPSFTLGAVEVTPLSLIEAYGTFANRGVHCEPVILKSITDREGTKYKVPSANCKRVLDKGVADAMNKIFQGPYTGGTARSARVPGVQMAGKTGTVPKNRAIWTVGYTPELVAASMISYDSHKDYKKFWKSRPSFLRNIRLPASGTYLSGFSGGDAGNRLLRPAFAAAIKAYPKTKFKKPPESVLRGKWLSVPSCTGMSVGGCRGALGRAGFSSHLDEVESPEPKGTVLGTDPAGKAPKLSSVAIKVSDGKGKQPEEEEPDDENPATPPPRRGG